MPLRTLQDNDVVIVSAVRTPMGGFQGGLSDFTAPELGAKAIESALERAGLKPNQIDEVLMGNVLSAGIGQAPARQAALGAGLDLATPCTAISKVCGSGMKAIMLAFDQIKAGSIDIAIAGGMESMSNAPYLIQKARAGLRLGHGELTDHMFYDGLEDARTSRLMGSFAQEVADRFEFTREKMDDYAIESLRRAKVATEQGMFDSEIVTVSKQTRNGTVEVSIDEQIEKANPEKIPALRPAFSNAGTITAANSSSISDGAAALVLMSAAKAKSLGVSPLAKVVTHTNHAQDPSEFSLAPIGSIQKLLKKTAWEIDDVDLFEINEAFAMVTMLGMQELNLNHDKVNPNGGACALGHPIGASGARIVVTLLHALKNQGKQKGIASVCIGGGEAMSIAIEIIEG